MMIKIILFIKEKCSGDTKTVLNESQHMGTARHSTAGMARHIADMSGQQDAAPRDNMHQTRARKASYAKHRMLELEKEGSGAPENNAAKRSVVITSAIQATQIWQGK